MPLRTLGMLAGFILAAQAALWAQQPTRDLNPPEWRDMTREEKRAYAHAMKERESARAGAGFQGVPLMRKVDKRVDLRPIFRTITYDTGTFTSVPDIPAISDNFSFGNRYDSEAGNPFTALPLTVTAMSVFMAAVNSSLTGTGNAFFTIFGPLNTAKTNASPVASVNVGSLQAGTFNIHSFFTPGVITAAPSYLAGVWNPTSGNTLSPTPCGNDCVGLDSSGTINGQGFHAIAIEDLGGGNFQMIPGANAIVRVSRKVPVELMRFTVED